MRTWVPILCVAALAALLIWAAVDSRRVVGADLEVGDWCIDCLVVERLPDGALEVQPAGRQHAAFVAAREVEILRRGGYAAVLEYRAGLRHVEHEE